MIFLDLFWTLFKIGAFTFGGGYAMVGLIQAEVVSKGWASETMFMNYLAISESTPGPIAVNTATFVGTHMAGIPGAVCATLGVVVPSFVIILIVSRMFDKYKKNKVVKGCMEGLKPSVIGMLAAAILNSVIAVYNSFNNGSSIFEQPAFYCTVAIFIIAVILEVKKLHPIWIIVVSMMLGIAAGYAGLINV